ncbi:hypothetical protein M501DRAFT_1018714 [Patellaria atrata CBS 101060]|uniref:Uncharacterized protein n=1 Tax=Patellaria atrata CBS 101060 TaxID=1346257 RepID=A0A9P4S631_9PEZI|nr:hypothetical protein M501DRAFT_1018714 [Patellaria atrata CBS 101060]
MLISRRLGSILFILVLLSLLLLAFDRIRQPARFDPNNNHVPTWTRGKRIACRGPRGRFLDKSRDDRLWEEILDIPYPEPAAGSHEALKLRKTWMTADGRYGAYGYNEGKESYSRKRVNWEKVEWAKLQNECLQRNRHRFFDVAPVSSDRRFELRPSMWKEKIPLLKQPAERPRVTGRTAVVLRGWDSFDFTEEDYINLRSMIVEAALVSGGEYSVYLLVHVRNKSRDIFANDVNYDEALQDIVPAELRDIAVLFDDRLLESWYPDVESHHPNLQIYQALQLFSHFYPEYDHVWNLELDTRFTGHFGHYLDALSNFAASEPRKQAKERASFFLIPPIHGTYADLTRSINTSLSGGGQWGPLLIPDIPHPLGPEPPVPTPEEDDFVWGVGDPADLIAMNACANVTRTEDWVYRDWVFRFRNGLATPRMFCPPAMSRSSRLLLSAVHDAQARLGLSVPSEATLPSFALWHGLKLSFPPYPWYQSPASSPADLNNLFNGGLPGSIANASEGMAYGEGMYNARPHYKQTNTATWWWSSPFPQRIIDAWWGKGKWEDVRDGDGRELPSVLRWHVGRVWAPNLALHPVKTNRAPTNS